MEGLDEELEDVAKGVDVVVEWVVEDSCFLGILVLGLFVLQQLPILPLAEL
jgi:hypothetical protein